MTSISAMAARITELEHRLDKLTRYAEDVALLKEIVQRLNARLYETDRRLGNAEDEIRRARR